MRAILRLQNQRAASGKESSFRIRGQDVNIEEVFQYFKRRHESVEGTIEKEAKTPSCISCWTPSPPSSPRLLSSEESNAVPEGFGPTQGIRGTKRKRASADSDLDNGTLAKRRAPVQFHAFDEEVFQMTFNELSKLLSSQSSIPHSPLPPTALLVPERLLLNIRAYFDTRLQDGYQLTDKHGKYIGRAPKFSDYHEQCLQFHEYCYSASSLARTGSFIQCRQQLSIACKLLPALLQTQHPRTLEFVINVLLSLYYDGFPEIIALLSRHIAAVSKTFLSMNHTWTNICQYFAVLDFSDFRATMVQSWRCAVDVIEKNIGSNDSTIAMKAIFIERACGTDYVSQQYQLQKLHEICAQFDNIEIVYQAFRISINLAWNAYKQGQYVEGEKLALKILKKLDMEGDLRSAFEYFKPEIFRVLAYFQFSLDSREEAEWNMRMAIKFIVEQKGINNPQAIGQMAELQRWLDYWGRHEEAVELKAEIERLIGYDEDDLVEAVG